MCLRGLSLKLDQLDLFSAFQEAVWDLWDRGKHVKASVERY